MYSTVRTVDNGVSFVGLGEESRVPRKHAVLEYGVPRSIDGALSAGARNRVSLDGASRRP